MCDHVLQAVKKGIDNMCHTVYIVPNSVGNRNGRQESAKANKWYHKGLCMQVS